MGLPNFTVVEHDLLDENWVLSSEKADEIEETPLDVQGAQYVVLFFESVEKDDNEFEVKVQFLDESGNVRAEVDQHVDSSLLSTSPASGNHYVYVTVAIASQYVDIKVEDTSAGNHNRIQGTANFN